LSRIIASLRAAEGKFGQLVRRAVIEIAADLWII